MKDICCPYCNILYEVADLICEENSCIHFVPERIMAPDLMYHFNESLKTITTDKFKIISILFLGYYQDFYFAKNKKQFSKKCTYAMNFLELWGVYPDLNKLFK